MWFECACFLEIDNLDFISTQLSKLSITQVDSQKCGCEEQMIANPRKTMFFGGPEN